MKKTIRRWLQPPVFEGDEAKTRRAGLLSAVMLSSMALAALFIFGAFLGTNVPSSSRIIATLLLAALALGWRGIRSGRITLIAFALSVVIFVFFAGVNFSLGTIRTPSAAIYVFWVILVGMLFDRPGILVATIASSLAILCLVIAENAGLLPQPNYSVGVTQWLNYTALFAVTASLVYYGNRRTQQALVRAENEIEQRQRSEADLRKLSMAVEQGPAAVMITDLSLIHI